jgi:hypothetical protein
MVLKFDMSILQRLPVWGSWFHFQVWLRAHLHRISLSPEVVGLLDDLPTGITHAEARNYYRALNAREYRSASDEPLAIRALSNVWQLHPMTVAVRYLGSATMEAMTRIVVTPTGTFFYDDTGELRVICSGASCMLTNEEPFWGQIIAADILREYTGQRISPDNLLGMDAVTAVSNRGTWKVSWAPATRRPL